MSAVATRTPAAKAMMGCKRCRKRIAAEPPSRVEKKGRTAKTISTRLASILSRIASYCLGCSVVLVERETRQPVAEPAVRVRLGKQQASARRVPGGGVLVRQP
jgi:hypothetical protein